MGLAFAVGCTLEKRPRAAPDLSFLLGIVDGVVNGAALKLFGEKNAISSRLKTLGVVEPEPNINLPNGLNAFLLFIVVCNCSRELGAIASISIESSIVGSYVDIAEEGEAEKRATGAASKAGWGGGGGGGARERSRAALL